MEIKTVIEDLVAIFDGRPEKTLPDNTTIRFEIGDNNLSCRATEDGLEIYKINDNGTEESRIITIGISSNKICIR